jgi:hypothetical protein
MVFEGGWQGLLPVDWVLRQCVRKWDVCLLQDVPHKLGRRRFRAGKSRQVASTGSQQGAKIRDIKVVGNLHLIKVHCKQGPSV